MSQSGLTKVPSSSLPSDVPVSFTTDLGTAMAVANNINVIGGTGITTSAVNDTITITSSASGGAYTLIQRQTISNNSEIKFTTGFGGYKYYILQLAGVTTSDFSVYVQYQFSTDGGSTWQATGYYQTGFIANLSGTSAWHTNNTNFFYAGEAQTNAAQGSLGCTITLYDLDSNALYKNNTQAFSVYNTTPELFYGTFGGMWYGANAVNGIRIYPTTGTLLAGTIDLIGAS